LGEVGRLLARRYVVDFFWIMLLEFFGILVHEIPAVKNLPTLADVLWNALSCNQAKFIFAQQLVSKYETPLHAEEERLAYQSLQIRRSIVRNRLACHAKA
jgi:hypothetical protein